MKLFRVTAFGLFLFFNCSFLAKAQTSLKIISYNIHHGADVKETNTLTQMGVFLKDQKADFVGLQEVDSVCTRSASVDQTGYLAAATGMYSVFVRHFAFQGGAYGNGLLSKYPLENLQHYRLPVDGTSANKSVGFFTVDARISKKKKIRLAVVHMDYRSQASRLQQAEIIRNILSDSHLPIVLLGDMNAYPETPEITKLTEGFQDISDCQCTTFPADTPDRKIDYIITSKDWKPVRSYTIHVQYSDHLPLIGVAKISAK